jgi:hypothetical protein
VLTPRARHSRLTSSSPNALIKDGRLSVSQYLPCACACACSRSLRSVSDLVLVLSVVGASKVTLDLLVALLDLVEVLEDSDKVVPVAVFVAEPTAPGVWVAQYSASADSTPSTLL